MVFYTVIQVALHYRAGITPTFASINRFSRDIEVYGDDIIVPVHSRRVVETALEALGLRINAGKSFSKGFFRESCGGDFYAGVNVTPTYLRYPLPEKFDPSNAQEYMSLVETSNQLYKMGLWKSCQVLRDMLQNTLRTKIPRSPYKGQGLLFHSVSFMTDCRYDRRFMGYSQKRIIFSPVEGEDTASEIGTFNKFFLSHAHEASDAPRDNILRFTTSVKRGVFKMKRRWIPASIGRSVI
jgi:hypothetical protein